MSDPGTTAKDVQIVLYRWAGAWGPFKVNIPCGECSLTLDVITDTFDTELAGVPVALDVREWLSEWWKPLLKGGWHAPIVMVEGRVVSQGHALNRGVLTEAIIDAHARRSSVEGNHLFGKVTCPHCVRAKGYLEQAGIDYEYHDVVKDPRSLYEMLARVKPIVGPRPLLRCRKSGSMAIMLVARTNSARFWTARLSPTAIVASVPCRRQASLPPRQSMIGRRRP